MGKSFRKERLNESIKELLGEIILNRTKDPRIGLVTITSVRVAQDLSSARVYYTVMGGDGDRVESRKGLESAKNFLRKTVSRELKLRTTPDLHFVYDDTLDKSFDIEQAIERLHRDESGREEEKE